MEKLLIILILGMLILDFSFFAQTLTIWKNKHSFGLSGISWTINFFGRLVWMIYGILLASWDGMVISVGQGFCALMIIPVLYYIKRNQKNDGEYIKEHFKKWLYALRIFVIICIWALVIISLVFTIKWQPIHYKPANSATIFIISTIGSACTGLSFLPQSIKTIKTKNTKSTSLYLCLAFILGNLFIIGFLFAKSAKDSAHLLQYVSGAIFTSIAVLSMIIILIIKIRNTINHNKKCII